MLRPQRNAFRDLLPLDGFWDFRADVDGDGEAQGWARGFTAEAEVAVPGSINEQLAERGYRDFMGPAWLARRFTVPLHFAGKRLRLRLNSADLRADVWLDGAHLGAHEHCFLPAEFECGDRLRAGDEALLVVRLDARLDPAHPLPGIDAQTWRDEGRPRDEVFPAVRYDFFPYTGLHRLPQLVAEPVDGFEALWVDSDFDAATGEGIARVAVGWRIGGANDETRSDATLPLAPPPSRGRLGGGWVSSSDDTSAQNPSPPNPPGPAQRAGRSDGLRGSAAQAGPPHPLEGEGSEAAALHQTHALHLRLRLRNENGEVAAESEHALSAGDAERIELRVSDVRPWSPETPTLYHLEATLLRDGELIDAYTLHIGFRRIRIHGTQLTLNGVPLELRGFGMHEDFPIVGKGQLLALTVKDFELLRWCGANSFRTSHYAYAEETLDLADRRGVLVISEVASVNLDFRRIDDSTLPRHCAMLDAQIARDRSHPCVIAWSLTNEPGYLAEAEYKPNAGEYFEQLFAHARKSDLSRPLTGANVGGRHGDDDPLFVHCDFLMLNRYVGWYDMPAQLARATTALREELDRLAARYGKPMLLSEFGADAVAGMHATTDQLFTEEYQARFVAAYWREIAAHPAVIGGHVWNFADFRTAQHHRRVVLNHKGVFTRTRDPKLAAWTLRRLWRGEPLEAEFAP